MLSVQTYDYQSHTMSIMFYSTFEHIRYVDIKILDETKINYSKKISISLSNQIHGPGKKKNYVLACYVHILYLIKLMVMGLGTWVGPLILENLLVFCIKGMVVMSIRLSTLIVKFMILWSAVQVLW